MPLAIEPAQSSQSKGKSIAASSSQSKMNEGSSFIQVCSIDDMSMVQPKLFV
jgi:hypothetical protein